MSIKASNINYSEQYQMYKINIGYYSRYFDFILFNHNGVQQSFGQSPHRINFEQHFNMDNKLIGITSFLGYRLIGIIDLQNLKSKYYLVQSADFFEFNIKNNDYYVFSYIDAKSKIGYITNFNEKDFDLKINKKNFTILNNMFSTKVFKKELRLPRYKFDIFQSSQNRFIDIVDFFYFDNFFDTQDNYDEFYKQLEIIQFKDIDIGNNQRIRFFLKKYKDKDSPKIKLNISIYGDVKNNFDCIELRKLLLSFKPNQFLTYTIDKEPYKSYFGFITNINNFQLKELKLNFSLPKNILNYDENFETFQKKFLLFRYGLFNIKDHLEMNQNIQTLKEDHSGIIQTKKRAIISSQNLENLISAYQDKYNKIKDGINKYINNKD